MIDIENDVFAAVATALRAEFTDPLISVYGEYVNAPANFPSVSIEEKDNSVLERTADSSNIENHATLMYEINAYSNKQSGKKIECKQIMATINDVMAGLGFTRTTMLSIPNIADATIYRMTARYMGIVSKNNTIYRR